MQGRACARVNEQGLGSDALGVDDLVLIKKQLEVVDKSTILLCDRFAIHQVTGFDKHLRAARAQSIAALIDEQAVVRTDHKVVGVVERARFDHDRGEIAHSAHGVLANPADHLPAIIAGEDFIAHLQLFNRALCA